jgi:hypothetical protein
MLGQWMHSPVGFGSYGNNEYGFGKARFGQGGGFVPGSLLTGGCDCPINPKTGQPGVCNPDLANQSEAATGITYDEVGCPVLQTSNDGGEVEILVDESAAGATAKEFIRSATSQPGVRVVRHQNWFAVLPLEKKLAVAGVGFGMLLMLIFAIKS